MDIKALERRPFYEVLYESTDSNEDVHLHEEFFSFDQLKAELLLYPTRDLKVVSVRIVIPMEVSHV